METIRVSVTSICWERGRKIFERQPSEYDFVPVASDEVALANAVKQNAATAVIVGSAPYTGALYSALPAGGVISRFGVGYDGIDLQTATERGLIVTNTPGVLDAPVAEYAISLLGTLARRIVDTGVATREGNWQPMTGREITGKTLAIVGLGRIGRRAAHIAGLGLGMRVIAFDCMPVETMLTACGISSIQELPTLGISAEDLDLGEALSQADFVSIHLNLTAETRGLFSEDALASMKSGAMVINTARGAMIDENALYDALSDGRLGGAALDVFNSEPYVPVDPNRDLRALDNVIMTPHCASNTTAANHRMASGAIANIRAALARDWEKVSLVNKDVLTRLGEA